MWEKWAKIPGFLGFKNDKRTLAKFFKPEESSWGDLMKEDLGQRINQMALDLGADLARVIVVFHTAFDGKTTTNPRHCDGGSADPLKARTFRVVGRFLF